MPQPTVYPRAVEGVTAGKILATAIINVSDAPSITLNREIREANGIRALFRRRMPQHRPHHSLAYR